jgi:hypothetical protein
MSETTAHNVESLETNSVESYYFPCASHQVWSSRRGTGVLRISHRMTLRYPKALCDPSNHVWIILWVYQTSYYSILSLPLREVGSRTGYVLSVKMRSLENLGQGWLLCELP